MTRKRFSKEDILNILRRVEMDLAGGKLTSTPPTFCTGILSFASIPGSSVVLELISSDGGKNPSKRPKFGSARQYAAYQALRNLLIDKGVSKVPVSDWHKAHADKSPDLTPAKRKDARQQLQDKGLVVINDSMVWINREVEANMEPYLDAGD